MHRAFVGGMGLGMGYPYPSAIWPSSSRGYAIPTAPGQPQVKLYMSPAQGIKCSPTKSTTRQLQLQHCPNKKRNK